MKTFSLVCSCDSRHLLYTFIRTVAPYGSVGVVTKNPQVFRLLDIQYGSPCSVEVFKTLEDARETSEFLDFLILDNVAEQEWCAPQASIVVLSPKETLTTITELSSIIETAKVFRLKLPGLTATATSKKSKKETAAEAAPIEKALLVARFGVEEKDLDAAVRKAKETSYVELPLLKSEDIENVEIAHKWMNVDPTVRKEILTLCDIKADTDQKGGIPDVDFSMLNTVELW